MSEIQYNAPETVAAHSRIIELKAIIAMKDSAALGMLQVLSRVQQMTFEESAVNGLHPMAAEYSKAFKALNDSVTREVDSGGFVVCPRELFSSLVLASQNFDKNTLGFTSPQTEQAVKLLAAPSAAPPSGRGEGERETKLIACIRDLLKNPSSESARVYARGLIAPSAESQQSDKPIHLPKELCLKLTDLEQGDTISAGSFEGVELGGKNADQKLREFRESGINPDFLAELQKLDANKSSTWPETKAYFEQRAPYEPFRLQDGWSYYDTAGTLHTGLTEKQAHTACDEGNGGEG